MPAPHLLVAISAHGYGHLSQVVPIINSLIRLVPGLRLTLRTNLPDEVLRSRIYGDYKLQTASDDFGLVMFDAVRVDGESSFTRYAELHHNWHKLVDECAMDLQSSGANLVLADLPYLTLAAAKKVSIPALAICSLNWFDIASNYLPDTPKARNILETMVEAYQGADVFLQPEPAMPMSWLNNRKAIGPVATPGMRQREALQQAAGIQADEDVVLFAMGGMPLDLDIEAWKPRRYQHLLIPPGWPIKHERVHLTTDICTVQADQAGNDNYLEAKPVTLDITTGTHEPGDINCDGSMGLADVILGLQVMTDNASKQQPSVGGDLNNDEKIGLDDVINILRQEADL